jgi:pimeloyl-ACP methyl ester carboxylesterase
VSALPAILAVFVSTTLASAQRHVSFPTSDGGLIEGVIYGEGIRGVVLAHGGRFQKEGWDKQAKTLAAAGFRTLAIDFRGEGQSRGGAPGRDPDADRHLDILGAIHYLRETGAKSVSVVGASMGGDYAAEAAQAEPAAIDRLVLLASGAYTPVEKMRGPKLFILGSRDANTEGLRLPRILTQYKKARAPKKLILLQSSAHAQFLFETDQGERLMREILQFLSARRPLGPVKK